MTEKRTPYSAVKAMPQDIDAERAVLGSILIDPDALPKASALITPADFYSERNATIFEAMVALAQQGARSDYVTLGDYLEARGKLHANREASDVGGSAYLSGLANETPTASLVETYALIVADKSKRRRAIALAGEWAGAAYDESIDIEARRGEILTAMVNDARVTGGAEHISTFTRRYVAEVEEIAKNPRDVYGIPTGYASLDDCTDGAVPGECILWCGDPGVGKTMAVMQMLRYIAEHGTPCAAYEMDTRWQEVVRRWLSAGSKVSAKSMKTGRMDGKMEAFYGAVGKLETAPIYLSDSTAWTTTSLRADLARLKDKYGVKVAAVDYLRQLRDTVGRGDDENVREKHIGNELKRIARDLEMSLILIHTKNKTGFRSQVPNLADVSGSGELPYMFENVAIHTRFLPMKDFEKLYDEETRANLVTVTLRKMRGNEYAQGYFHLVRRDGLPAFGDYAPDTIR